MKLVNTEREIRVLSINDADYPQNLRYIYDPPPVLYVHGKILPEDSLAVAIVGSRQATYYGLKNAQELAFELASRGITIISGLARGVDSAAHRGALKAGGRTIAVLGSGLNVIYPAENERLAEEIAEHGAILSEFPYNTAPLRQNFPRRNRLISGLSLGVVIVEAAKRSGALITASCALEQGREVFALPGKVDSLTSQGTHQLIKQGAKLVESGADIIEELEPLKSLEYKQREGGSTPEFKVELTEDEEKIYSGLTSEPLHIDEIMQQVHLPYGRLYTALLKLEQKRLVKEMPGKMFVRSGGSDVWAE